MCLILTCLIDAQNLKFYGRDVSFLILHRQDEKIPASIFDSVPIDFHKNNCGDVPEGMLKFV